MSEHEPEQSDQGNEGISDDQLPPDLQPSEDNPLARHPDQTGDEDDAIGADTEGEPETAPLREEDSAYGHEGDSGSGDSGSSSGSGSAGNGPDDGRVTAEEDDGSSTLENGGGGAG